jgi:signal transduction histidine kinase
LGVLLLAAAVSGLAAAATFVLRSYDDPQTELRRADRRAQAVGLASQLRPWFVATRQQTQAAARLVEDRVTDEISARRVDTALLASAAEQAPLLESGLYVVDRRGVVVATSPRAAPLLRATRAGGVVERALAGVPATSGIVTDPLLRRAEVRVAAPVRNDGGEVIGALVGVSAAQTGTVRGVLLPPAESGPVRTSIVTSDDREVVAGPRTVPLTADLRSPVRSGRTKESLVEYDGEGRVARLAGAAPLAAGWVVVVQGERAAVVPPPRRDLTLAAGLSVAAAAVACLGFVLFALRLRRQERRAEADRVAMLTVAGHELRTPLTQILGSAQLLSRRWSALDDRRRAQLIDAVGQQARTLERLVERLLHAGRLAAGQERGLNTRPADVGAIARDAAADVRSRVHTVNVSCDRPVMAQIDPAALRQVLGHLLDNAVKYSPDGGPIDVAVTPATALRRRVEISVTDQGVGLPADHSRIFERFVQGEDTDTRVHDEGGVGLGLAIVRDLVVGMGGSVRAERRARGARFVVDLPPTD